jgi:hypothetical protein
MDVRGECGASGASASRELLPKRAWEVGRGLGGLSRGLSGKKQTFV